MEDLLLPAFDHLSPGSWHTLVILRPYGLKWDTVSVSAEQNGSFRTVTLVDKKNAKEWLILKDSTHVLWIRHSDQEAERRPLEGTSLSLEFEKARKVVGSLK
jgi:hypothetical protein